MKYAVLEYNISTNLGDQVQSLAAAQHLPEVHLKLNRDDLATVTGEERILLIMNGWFSRFPKTSFPPSEVVSPIFFGFHLAERPDVAEHYLSSESINYFKRHEPIGCRDRHTADVLKSHGVASFYSKCLTLTFPKRQEQPKNGKVFLVETDGIPIPEALSKDAIQVTQVIGDVFGDELKTALAEKLLDTYRTQARLVITTRLHCALPCVAMGIPVIFFGDPDDYRISILSDIGVTINPVHRSRSLLGRLLDKLPGVKQARTQRFLDGVDWNPAPVAIETEKAAIVSAVRQAIDDKIKSHAR